jgi:hypothetical protein
MIDAEATWLFHISACVLQRSLFGAGCIVHLEQISRSHVPVGTFQSHSRSSL